MPTVNGRLSFKIIGETRYPAEADYANASTKSHQYVFACQERNLSDVLFSRLLSNLLGVDGRFEFVFCARARRQKSDAMLIGRIYVSRVRKKQRINDIPGIANALKGIRTVDFGVGSTLARQLYLQAHDELEAAADFFADVVLHRNGLVGISRIRWRDSKEYFNSLSYARSTGTDLQHNIADQMFYFLRDISHQHQHHGADADTITSTIHVTNSGITWAADIVFSLYYHIITIKRSSDPINHVRVLGVLAYLRSLKGIISKVEAEKGLSAGIPYFDDDATKESITATKNYIELLSTRRRQKSDSFRTVLFAMTATALTLISFISGFAAPEVKPIPAMQDVANFLRANAYLCFIPLLILLIWWAANMTFADKYDFKRDVIRLTLVNRTVSAFLIVALAAISAVCAFLLGWPIVEQMLISPTHAYVPMGR